MSETEDENDLMSEFRKLQTETTGIRSLFSDKSSIDVVGLTGNKLAKDIHDFCEKTIELQDKFNEKVSDELKNQDESMRKIVEKIETKIEKNQTEMKQTLLGEIQKIQEVMKSNQTEMQKAQEESNKTIREELKAIRKEIKETKSNCESGNDPKTDVTDSDVSQEENENHYEKEFQLKHIFKNVLELKRNVRTYSEEEEFFNVPWQLYILRDDNSLAVYLECCKSLEDDKWSIDTNVDICVISPVGEPLTYEFIIIYGNFDKEKKFTASGFSDFLSWDKMKSDYLVNGNLTVEAHVKINKMTGIYKKNSRNFDENMEGYSDTVLIVQYKKFHVFKLLLIAQSTYFKDLLSDCIKGSEINVPGVDSDDFLVFLAVIYGDSLDESTVEVILMLSEQFEAENVIKRCEEFLLNVSKKSLKKKLQLASEYNLEELKKKCISEIKSVEEIESVNPEYLHECDPSITFELLQKALSFK